MAEPDERLVALIESMPSLRDGWLGRELSSIIHAEKPKLRRHHERFERFRFRFNRMFAPRFGNAVLNLSIYRLMPSWELWYCGFSDTVEAHEWWNDKLLPIERVEICAESRSTGKRIRLRRYVMDRMDSVAENGIINIPTNFTCISKRLG